MSALDGVYQQQKRSYVGGTSSNLSQQDSQMMAPSGGADSRRNKPNMADSGRRVMNTNTNQTSGKSLQKAGSIGGIGTRAPTKPEIETFQNKRKIDQRL